MNVIEKIKNIYVRIKNKYVQHKWRVNSLLLVLFSLATCGFSFFFDWPRIWNFNFQCNQIIIANYAPFALLILINFVLILKWRFEERDDVKVYPFTTLVIYGLAALLIPTTYVVTKVLSTWSDFDSELWNEVMHINYASSEFAMMIGLPAFLFTVYGALKSSVSVAKAEKIISDLVDTQVTASGATSNFVECFQVALLKPMQEAGKRGKLINASLLLANPIYGLYSECNKKDREDFWKDFVESKANRELILYSPDAHYNFLVRHLLTYAVRKQLSTEGNTHGDVTNNIAKIQKLIIEQMNSLERQSPESLKALKLKKPENEREDLGESLKLWLTADSGYRIAKYDYELTLSGREGQPRTNVFVILTHPSSMEHGPDDFVGTLIPITQTLHKNITGSKDSVYEQFKQCPYTLLTDEEARIKSKVTIGTDDVEVDEYKAIAFDMLYLRTSNRPYRMAYLKEICLDLHEKFSPNTVEDPIDSIKSMIGCFVSYFQRLDDSNTNENEKARPPYISDSQKGSIESSFLRNITSTLVYDCPPIDAIAENLIRTNIDGAEISKSHFINEYKLFTNQNINTSRPEISEDPLVNYIAVLYFILSSGFRESKYAEFRRKRVRDK